MRGVLLPPPKPLASGPRVWERPGGGAQEEPALRQIPRLQRSLQEVRLPWPRRGRGRVAPGRRLGASGHPTPLLFVPGADTTNLSRLLQGRSPGPGAGRPARALVDCASSRLLGQATLAPRPLLPSGKMHRRRTGLQALPSPTHCGSSVSAEAGTWLICQPQGQVASWVSGGERGRLLLRDCLRPPAHGTCVTGQESGTSRQELRKIGAWEELIHTHAHHYLHRPPQTSLKKGNHRNSRNVELGLSVRLRQTVLLAHLGKNSNPPP